MSDGHPLFPSPSRSKRSRERGRAAPFARVSGNSLSPECARRNTAGALAPCVSLSTSKASSYWALSFTLVCAPQAAMKQEALIGTAAPLDALTVGAIGILAYMLGNVLHEGLGHGGACVLVGAKPLVISSVHFECSSDSRLVFAGGTAMNLLAGALFFAL